MGTLIRNNRISPLPSRWRECAVCGFEYPERVMYFHRGSYICFEHDDDENRTRQAESFDLTHRQRVGNDPPPERLD